MHNGIFVLFLEPNFSHPRQRRRRRQRHFWSLFSCCFYPIFLYLNQKLNINITRSACGLSLRCRRLALRVCMSLNFYDDDFSFYSRCAVRSMLNCSPNVVCSNLRSHISFHVWELHRTRTEPNGTSASDETNGIIFVDSFVFRVQCTLYTFQCWEYLSRAHSPWVCLCPRARVREMCGESRNMRDETRRPPPGARSDSVATESGVTNELATGECECELK